MQLIEKESAKQKRQSGPLKPKDFSNQQFTYMLKKIVETNKNTCQKCNRRRHFKNQQGFYKQKNLLKLKINAI